MEQINGSTATQFVGNLLKTWFTSYSDEDIIDFNAAVVDPEYRNSDATVQAINAAIEEVVAAEKNSVLSQK